MVPLVGIAALGLAREHPCRFDDLLHVDRGEQQGGAVDLPVRVPVAVGAQVVRADVATLGLHRRRPLSVPGPGRCERRRAVLLDAIEPTCRVGCA